MAEYNKEKYYWFRMKEDFFNRHDIKIMKAVPNGKDYVIFYLQLLCESLSHDGRLRFNENIPYNAEMLSVVTDTNIDIVKGAMKFFRELNLIEVFDDQTIYMTKIKNLIGFTTKGAEKKKLQRETQRLALGTEGGQMGDKCPPEIEIEKDIDIYKEKDIEKENSEIPNKARKKFVVPTYEEVEQFASNRGRKDLAMPFYEYFTTGEWKDSEGKPVKNWKQKFITWENHNPQKDVPKKNTAVHFKEERKYTDDEFERVYADVDDIEI